jgi:hypothetical protein
MQSPFYFYPPFFLTLFPAFQDYQWLGAALYNPTDS